jgi:hypothetical protein
MDNEFHVEIEAFSILKDIDGVWTTQAFTALLDEMEFGSVADLSDSDIREMCLLSLQDLEPEDAAALVLKQHLGDRLSKGQIATISVEMLDEKPWEEYADMTLHESLFHVSSLMYQAFPKVFPEPDAVRLRFQVKAMNGLSQKILKDHLGEPFLVRLLAGGMDENVALHRLFEDQLAGGPFPEAESIVWTLTSEKVSADTFMVEVVSSGSWLDPLRTTKSYTLRGLPV